jgi:hypothetical protein
MKQRKTPQQFIFFYLFCAIGGDCIASGAPQSAGRVSGICKSSTSELCKESLLFPLSMKG